MLEARTITPATVQLVHMISRLSGLLDDARQSSTAYTKLEAEICYRLREAIQAEAPTGAPGDRAIALFQTSIGYRNIQACLNDQNGRASQKIPVLVGSLRDMREALRGIDPEQLPVPLDSSPKLLTDMRRRGQLTLVVSNGPARPSYLPRLRPADYLKPMS